MQTFYDVRVNVSFGDTCKANVTPLRKPDADALADSLRGKGNTAFVVPTYDHKYEMMYGDDAPTVARETALLADTMVAAMRTVGMSQERLAQLANVSRTTVASFLGKCRLNLKYKTIEAMANVLGLPMPEALMPSKPRCPHCGQRITDPIPKGDGR